MASEQEIAEGIESLFRETNPNSFNSLNDVVLRLQSKLGFDLSHKVDFIRNHITLLFTSHHPTPSATPPPASAAAAAAAPASASAVVGIHSNPNPNPSPNSNVTQHPNALHHPNPNPSPSSNVTQHPNALHHPNPNPSPNSNDTQHPNALHHPNPNPNPNPNSIVTQLPNAVHHQNYVQLNQQQQHPASVGHVRPHLQPQQPQQHMMFQGQSHFPRGPTEISFAQPGGAVVSEAKDSQKPKRRGGPGGLNKLCGVSPQLQAIVGQPAMPRTEIVKQLWAYIRKNNLQDPSNKRKIICNEELRLVFEVDCTDMFQMNKLLAKHILPLDPTKDSGQQSKKLKVEESKVTSPEPAPIVVSKVPSSEPTPIVISESLARFFGTSEKKMLPSEVYKRIDEYIKTEGLESPVNSTVVCDSKLQELLGCESITTPEIPEALARNHLFQQA